MSNNSSTKTPKDCFEFFQYQDTLQRPEVRDWFPRDYTEPTRPIIKVDWAAPHTPRDEYLARKYRKMIMRMREGRLELERQRRQNESPFASDPKGLSVE